MTAQTKNSSRQWPLEVIQKLDITFIGTGNELTFYIPPNGYLKDINAFVETVFDGTGTVTLSATDGTTTFINAQSVKSAGDVTVAAKRKFFPSGATVTVSIADQNANSTVGTVRFHATYIKDGRETEVQN